MPSGSSRRHCLCEPMGKTKIVDDLLGKALDVIGVREYIGWKNISESAKINQWSIACGKPLI